MTCQTCGAPVSASFCVECGTPAGAPAVAPGARTFGVRGVGIAASVLVLLTLLADALTYTMPLVAGSLIGGPADVEGAEAAVVYEGLTAGGSLIGLLVTAVLVIVWIYRAHRNLDAFPGAYPAMRHGWAIAGWLIPIANFVLPFRVMSDVVRGSLPRGRPMVLVGVWWGAFLVSSLGARQVGRGSGELPYPETTDDVAAYSDAYASDVGLSLVVLAGRVLAGVLLIVLITRVSAAQEARIRRVMPTAVMPGMTYPAPPTSPAPPPGPPYASPPPGPPYASPPPGPPYASPPYAPPPYASPPREPGEPSAPGGATIGA